MRTILLFFLLNTLSSSREPSGLLCKYCTQISNALLTKTYGNLPDIESTLSKLCSLFVGADVCKYFLTRLGHFHIQSRIGYFMDNNYFCSHYLSVCDQTTVAYDFAAFKKTLYEKYPKPPRPAQIKVFKDFDVLSLNDIHIQTDYLYKADKNCDEVGNCCADSTKPAHHKEDMAGYWGAPKSSCDIPKRTFEKTLEYIKKNLPKPTFLAVLGDNYGHNYYRKEPIEIAKINQFVYTSLRENFPDTVILPSLGNHECDPVDNLDFSDPDNFVYQHIFPAYKPSISEDQFADLTKKGFYSATFEEYGVKFVSLNSQLYDNFNSYMTRNGVDPLGFFDNFAQELNDSELKQQKVILLSHIPVVDTFSNIGFNRNLKVVITRFKDTITAHFSGHTHQDSTIFVKDDEKKDIIGINYVSPSLTTNTSYNPSFRVYHFQNREVHNYIQYAADIDHFNDLADKGEYSFEFSVAYDFRKEYDLDSWSSSEDYAALQQKIFGVQAYTEKYVKNFVTSSRAVEPLTTLNFALCCTLDVFDEFSECLTDSLPYYGEWNGIKIFRAVFSGDWYVKKDE